jgi:phage baseplate assembly protein W
MAKKQYFGIKYPFTSDGFENYFLDLNRSKEDQVKSELLHLIFTPKRQRIRMPDFGTDLIKYIFEPNDNVSWDEVKTEIESAVTLWIPNVALNNIQVVSTDDGHGIYVRVDYTVANGNLQTANSVVVEI